MTGQLHPLISLILQILKLLGGGQGWWDWPGSLDFFSGCIKTGTHVSLYVPSA